MARFLRVGLGTACIGAGCWIFQNDVMDMLIQNSNFLNAFAPKASEVSRIASFKSSGILFKDEVQVDSFADPKVNGVTLYISTVEKPIVGFLQDSSAASICAIQTGPISFSEKIDKSIEGEEVFSEKRNVLFKELHVRRIYDFKNNSIVYVAYSTRLMQDSKTSNSRYKTSIAAVSLGNTKPL